MERVLLVELRMLADIGGESSIAGRALAAAKRVKAPVVYQTGRWLFVCDAATQEDGTQDTLVMRRFW